MVVVIGSGLCCHFLMMKLGSVGLKHSSHLCKEPQP